VFSFLGETHKSFTWTQLSSTNLSLFWLRTNKKRIIIFIVVGFMTLFLLLINTNNSGIFLQSGAFKLVLYLFWRTFDWLYFFLVQLQYLIITVILSFFFTLFNWLLSSNLNLTSWMRKHHAAIIPTYSTKEIDLGLVQTKAKFSLLLNNTRSSLNLPEMDQKLIGVNLFNCAHAGLDNFGELSTYFKSYFKLLFSVNQPSLKPRTFQSLTANPLFTVTCSQTAPLRRVSPFSLNSLVGVEHRSLSLLTNDRENITCTDAAYAFLGIDQVVKQLCNYIRITRWFSLNTTANQSELINNENLLNSLNIGKSVLDSTQAAFTFNSKEWLDYRNVSMLNTLSVKKLYLKRTLLLPTCANHSYKATSALPFNYFASIHTSPSLLSVTYRQSPIYKLTYKKLLELNSTTSYFNKSNLATPSQILSYGTSVTYRRPLTSRLALTKRINCVTRRLL